MSGEQEQAELFAVPAAYQPSAWVYVPNGQDVCAPVELDEPEPDERRCDAPTRAVQVPGRLPVIGGASETARAS